MATIKTTVFQNLVSNACKGAGNNKMLPLTGMMEIVVKEKDEDKSIINVCTTDATNYLYVSRDIEKTDNLYVVVSVDQFSKLVSKITTDTITLNLVGGKLMVQGNGTYNIELPLDEEGNLVKFPSPVNDIKTNDDTIHYTFKLRDVQSILTYNKAALSTSNDIPCYTGYYVDNERVITTNTAILCNNALSLVKEPVLLSREMVDLLGIFTADYIDVYDVGTHLLFATETCVLYGAKMTCINDFQINVLKGLVEQEFPSKVSFIRESLIHSLDRLSLFVGVFDKNVVNLTISSNNIKVFSPSTNSEETVNVIDGGSIEDFNCNIDVEFLLSQLKANDCEKVEIHYGAKNAIKIVNDNVSQIIALYTEE